jgi:hypothetical protein
MSVRCDVFIDEAKEPLQLAFSVVPRTGEFLRLLVDDGSAELFSVLSVVHVPESETSAGSRVELAVARKRGV